MLKLTNISIVLLTTTLINLVILTIAWRRRKIKSGKFFFWFMLMITFWTLFSALDYAATTIELRVFFAKVESVSYHFALVLFLTFVLSFVGFEQRLKKAPVKVLLWIVPVINILLTLTNQFHHWVWTDFTWSEINKDILIFQHGVGFGWIAISDYIAVLISIISLFWHLNRASQRGRLQTQIILLALTIPIVSNIIYLIAIPGIEGIDWTSLFFSFSGILILFALFGAGLLDIVPIARNKLIEGMADPVIVLDSNHNIVDINQAACTIFNVTIGVIGKKAENVFPDPSNPIDRILSNQDSEQTLPLNISIQDKRYFDIELTSLKDHNEKPYAKLFVFRDITRRHQASLEQKKRLEEIQALNEKLSSTQELVVEQAKTIAAVEERERLGRDLHDSVNQSIHSVILSAETLQAILAKGQVAEAIHIAERIQTSGLQALKEIRLLLYKISSPFVSEEADLLKAIEERLQTVERRVGIQAEIVILHDQNRHFAPEVRENLYWLVMEALNNALKYAHANKVLITLSDGKDRTSVEIKDNGRGFDPDKIKGGGLGMRTMRERADLLGGELTIESKPGEGTTVRFWTTIEE